MPGDLSDDIDFDLAFKDAFVKFGVFLKLKKDSRNDLLPREIIEIAVDDIFHCRLDRPS